MCEIHGQGSTKEGGEVNIEVMLIFILVYQVVLIGIGFYWIGTKAGERKFYKEQNEQARKSRGRVR